MKNFDLLEGRDPWEYLLGLTLPLVLFFSLISISLEQIFIALSVVLWAVKLWHKKERLAAPSFFFPLLAYTVLSIFSSIFSVNPGVSLKDSRELLLFLIIPLVYTSFSRIKDLNRTALALLGSGCLAAGYSVLYHFVKAGPGERVKGFMGHYMTQAGVLLLFCSLALSMFVFERRKIRWLWGISLLLALFSLALTQTRSAWIGFFVVVCFVLLVYRPVGLILVPIVAGLVFLASPQPMKKRALSVFNLDYFSNRQRLEYFRAGIRIIKEYPLLGTGPDTVDMVFQNPKYGLSEDAKRNVHLHDNFLQIGAERGVPTLIVWLAFVAWTFLGLLRLLRNKSPGLFPLAVGALAAVLALVSSGLFEYNFGDSEVSTLFLYLITMPFAYFRVQNKDERS